MSSSSSSSSVETSYTSPFLDTDSYKLKPTIAIDSNIKLAQTPTTTTNTLSSPSPSPSLLNSQPTDTFLPPLKSILSEWWLSNTSTSSTTTKSNNVQCTSSLTPSLTFSSGNVKSLLDDKVLLKSKTDSFYNKSLLDLNGSDDDVGVMATSQRPKSMLDQYLPILSTVATSTTTASTTTDLAPSSTAALFKPFTTTDLAQSSTPFYIPSKSPSNSSALYKSFHFDDEHYLPGPSNLLLPNKLSEIDNERAAHTSISVSPNKSKINHDDEIDIIKLERKTAPPSRKQCNHEIELNSDLDRTYFWRKTILTTNKFTVNTADYDLPQEAANEYCFGGYERVEIGHIYSDRYLVIRKIGWGHFSTVWLCGDQLLKRLVAIKIVKSGKVFLETAQDEISLLRDVSIVGCDNNLFDYFVKIYDQFEFNGENGKHKAIVFELLGCNLYKLTTLTLGIGVDMTYVKMITKQVLEGLMFLHEECGIIHTDIKPENILIAGSPEYHRKVVLNVAKWLKFDGPWPKQFVSNWNENREYVLSSKVKQDIKEFITSIHISRCSCDIDQFNHREYTKRMNDILSDNYKKKDYPPEINVFHVPSPKNLRIKIADLGNACYDHTHFCDQIQTCQYRGPETILGARYTYSADIWSLACVVFELAAGDYLFDPRASSKGDYSVDDDHLAHMIELLGPMPEHVYKSGKWSEKFFTYDGKLRRISELNPWSIEQVLEEKYEFSKRKAQEFAAFLKPMLEYDPKKRISARECLKHPWLHSV